MQLLDQLVSLVGAALILAAYLALQRGWMRREDRVYNACNLFGSLLLTYVAVQDRRVGFIVLEGAWALLSLPGTIARPKQKQA
jgi:drug/metabolite transporter (DMT)-like permease